MPLPSIDGYSFWLLFESNTEEFLQKEINRLADLFGAVRFKPHITLASVEADRDEKKLIHASKLLEQRLTPFEIETGNVLCGKNPYQKLTISLSASHVLEKAHSHADTLLGGDYSKREYPHISLLYSAEPCKDVKSSLSIASIDIPQRVLCTGISLVRCKGTPADWVTLDSRDIT